MQQTDQFLVINRADIREAHAQPVVIGADQGRRDEGCILICDAHQRSGVEAGVESARRIGQNDRLDAHERHDADRQHDFLHRITLVKVDAAVHQDHGHGTDIAENVLALVSLNC